MEIDVWLKKYRIFSRSLLLVSFGQMLWITHWGTIFSTTSSLPGLEIAAVLAAAQVPATALFASVYKTYAENKLP